MHHRNRHTDRPIGRLVFCLNRRMTSKYGMPGFTINISAPVDNITQYNK